jgi:hypothetical protein
MAVYEMPYGNKLSVMASIDLDCSCIIWKQNAAAEAAVREQNFLCSKVHGTDFLQKLVTKQSVKALHAFWETKMYILTLNTARHSPYPEPEGPSSYPLRDSANNLPWCLSPRLRR